MRRLALLLAVLALAGAAEARGHAPPAADRDVYVNVDGHRVRRPVAAPHAPAGASARCRDGTYSFSEHHRGTCSHHGDVATWLR